VTTDETTGTDTEMAAAQVAALLDAGQAQVIDVREDYEHEAGHVPGSRHIDLTQLTDAAETLDQARAVVFYCRSGDRSSMPAEAFRASGWDAHNMAGGLTAWAEAGLPLEPEDGEVAHRRPGPQT
jgi:rhodanese-related sulfurtransferase